MKKQPKQLSPESFEAVCRVWEQRATAFVSALSDGGIPTLKNAEWTVWKKRVCACDPEPEGKRKRLAFGPRFSSSTPLNRTAANAVWKRFKLFAKEHGLSDVERLRNNEEGLGRYDFRAADPETKDGFSCTIDLPGEWNVAGIHLSIVVGPRYRNEDL